MSLEMLSGRAVRVGHWHGRVTGVQPLAVEWDCCEEHEQELRAHLPACLEVLGEEGWVPLHALTEQVSRVEREVREILGESLGESTHDPFKRKSKIGQGPRGRYNFKRKDRWSCTCTKCKKRPCQGSTTCTCKKGEATRKVKISYDYKRGYNDEYHAGCDYGAHMKWHTADCSAAGKKKAADAAKAA